MKNNIFLKVALSVLAIGGLASCAGDYLDTYPTSTITTAQVTADTDNVTRGMQGICRGMYNQYQDMNQFMTGEDVFMMYGEMPSQDYYSTTFYSLGWSDMINMQFINLNMYITANYMWSYAYTIINQANDILINMDRTEGTQADKDYLRASLLTLRAHGYWRLLQCYAPRWQDSNNGEAKCVVLRISDNIGSAPLATMNEVLDQMYADLDEAIALYKGSKTTRTFKWEPNINVAYGTYARLALLKQDWQKAYDMATEAMKGYPLMSNDEEIGGFAQNNGEWIWGTQNREDETLYYWNFGIYYACNSYYSYKANYAGAGAINIDLYHKIPATDVRKNWFMGDEDGPLKAEDWWNVKNKYILPEFVGFTDNSITNARLKRNIRIWLSDKNPNPAVFADPYSVPAADKDVQDPRILYSLGAQLKFWAKGQGSVNVNMGDVPWMRSAEMYLTAAEAAAELGKTSEAQKLLLEMNKLRNPEYTCSLSGQALIDEVRLYRRIELWGEGFNWFDFKRWNMAIDRREWIEGDVTSGNFPKAVAIRIEPKEYNGWVIALPRQETEYNEDIKK